MNRLFASRAIKVALFLVCLIPVAALAYGFYRQDLGANPVEFLEHATGDWAIRLLLITLALTPLRRLSGWSRLSTLRRTLGLFAFFYAMLHVLAYLFFDKQFDATAIASDIGKRRYITVGFLSWVSMAALAVTSTDGWVRRMGAQRWQRLHKLVYLAVVAAVIHYYWLVKSDIRLPALYGSLLAILFVARLPWLWKRRADAGFTARLARVRRETADAVTLTFTLPKDKELAAKPGQFLTFEWLVNGEKLPRSYSISSAPGLPDSFDITVKKQGAVSTFLNESARKGLEVVAHGPYGRFVLDPPVHTAPVFFAGGSGITPVICMLRHIERSTPHTKALLFYASRDENNVVFDGELKRLRQVLTNFRVISLITQPTPAWIGERGYISKALVERELPEASAHTFFICGPAGFMSSVREILTSLGAGPDQILQERFSSSASSMTAGAATLATIEFLISGKRVECSSADTVLAVAERNGVAITASCRIGQCGTCATRVLGGEVEAESDEGLSPAMRSEGFRLLCVSHARGAISVDA